MLNPKLISNANYSTEETIIGTWLGKPLYRKVMVINGLPKNTNTEYPTQILNGELVRYEGNVLLNSAEDNKKPLPYISPNSASGNIYIDVKKDVSNIDIQTNTDRTNSSATVIVEYTKTTD